MQTPFFNYHLYLGAFGLFCLFIKTHGIGIKQLILADKYLYSAQAFHLAIKRRAARIIRCQTMGIAQARLAQGRQQQDSFFFCVMRLNLAVGEANIQPGRI